MITIRKKKQSQIGFHALIKGIIKHEQRKQKVYSFGCNKMKAHLSKVNLTHLLLLLFRFHVIGGNKVG